VKEYFLIAKIISIYGKNGFVRIKSYSDFPDRFFDLVKVYLDFWGSKKKFVVQKAIKRKDYLALKFKNFDSAQDAAFLVDKEIFINGKNLVQLPEDYHFVHDLVGSKVFRNDVEIGILKDVLKYPANDVYAIESKSGRELLLPAVSEFIKSFDPYKKVLILTPGDNFYENDED